MNDASFSVKTVATLAKRAGNRCSNPDCNALTCGPAEAANASITIGEAAHIYGAQTGSARFKTDLSVTERSEITNAIWLCRNCHKTVDSDSSQYPADLLFEWRRLHEAKISALLGKPSEIIRQKLVSKTLQEFSNESYLAQQIVIDKPDNWEYKLTIELIRTLTAPTLARYNALERGLYTKPETPIRFEELSNWMHLRSREALKLIEAFSALLTEELVNSWGPPGEPGNEGEILRTSHLLKEFAERVLQYEEAIKFSLLPKEFEEVQKLIYGISGQMLHKLAQLPIELAKPFEKSDPSGTYNIHIKLEMPDGWSERFDRESKKAFDLYYENHDS